MPLKFLACYRKLQMFRRQMVRHSVKSLFQNTLFMQIAGDPFSGVCITLYSVQRFSRLYWA